MREASGVDVVDTEEHLLKVVLGNGFGEGARERDVVEELPTRDHLLSNIGDLNGCAIFLDHGGVFLEFEVLDNVLMVKLGSRTDLFLEKPKGSFIEAWVVQLEDLQGIVSAISRSADLDFGGEAGAEGSTESKSVESSGHFVCKECYFDFYYYKRATATFIYSAISSENEDTKFKDY